MHLVDPVHTPTTEGAARHLICIVRCWVGSLIQQILYVYTALNGLYHRKRMVRVAWIECSVDDCNRGGGEELTAASHPPVPSPPTNRNWFAGRVRHVALTAPGTMLHWFSLPIVQPSSLPMSSSWLKQLSSGRHPPACGWQRVAGPPAVLPGGRCRL